MAEIPSLAPAQATAPKGKWLIVIAAVLTLGAAGAGTWLWRSAGHSTASAKASASTQPLAPAQYLALDPPFVVNFEAEQLVRFLQVTVQLMSRDATTLELVKMNDPVIRNDLLLLLGNQNYTVLSTREGKERLRAEALHAVRAAVSAAGGKAERVEALYFTSFVMQ